MKRNVYWCVALTLLTGAVPGWAQPAPPPFYGEAEAAIVAGKYAEALRLAGQAVKGAPNDGTTVGFASVVAWQVGAYDVGLPWAVQALKLNPKTPTNHAKVMFNAWGRHDLPLARREAKQTLDLGSKAVGAKNYQTAAYIVSSLADQRRKVVWTFEPAKCISQEGAIALALPSINLPYQTGKFSVAGASGTKVINLGGNSVALVQPDGNRPFQVTTHMTFRAYSFKKELAAYNEQAGIPGDVAPYLGKSSGIDPQGPLVVRVAATLRDADKVRTVRNILAWIKYHTKYELSAATAAMSAEDVLRKRITECSGKARVFAALCRACGIPARQASGLLASHQQETHVAALLETFAEKRGKSNHVGALLPHSWAEFYLPGAGWIPADPAYAETLGLLPSGHVRVCHFDAADHLARSHAHQSISSASAASRYFIDEP